ncbi:RrF2 family transcriptional regulator [Clostridium tertium]|uniref:RrF2 family transcriptional regulator n=1 Tax=Clostridium tertium TaxID=1559 RepID=UPI00374EF4F6
MQLNITTDYAIRIVRYLAIKAELTTVKEISEEMVIPENYINKIARKLKEAGIINTYNGAKGGYELRKHPNEITILDIVKVMEKTIKINRCLEKDDYCSRGDVNTCSLYKYYRIIQSELEGKLGEITIENCMR